MRTRAPNVNPYCSDLNKYIAEGVAEVYKVVSPFFHRFPEARPFKSGM